MDFIYRCDSNRSALDGWNLFLWDLRRDRMPIPGHFRNYLHSNQRIAMKKENKQRLDALKLASDKEKHPNIPESKFIKNTYKDSTANGLTKAITTFIQLNGYQAERINTMGVARKKMRTDGKVIGITWTKGTGTPGSADISATIRGRSVKIEVKIGKDRQSEAQMRYQESIEKAGGIYIIARDFDSFVEWYDQFIESCK